MNKFNLEIDYYSPSLEIQHLMVHAQINNAAKELRSMLQKYSTKPDYSHKVKTWINCNIEGSENRKLVRTQLNQQ